MQPITEENPNESGEDALSGRRYDKAADIEDYAKGFDAYYGSPSPFVPVFSMQHKPVMLADYEVG